MRVIAVILFLLVGTVAALACPSGQHQQCFIGCWCAPNLPGPGEIIPDEIDPTVVLTGGMSLLWEEAKNQNVPVLSQAAHNVDALADNLENEFRTAFDNT